MIAITGATGNIGSQITNTLLSRGQKVRCIARTAADLKQFADRGAEVSAISLAETQELTEAFSGSDAVFAMIPPNYTTYDFLGYQEIIGTSLIEAIRESGVKYVVNLSSVGAHLEDKTGPIKGLHAQEQRLNKLKGVNVLHLRPAFFMENLLVNAHMIKTQNILGSGFLADTKLPMVATRDIALAAADRLEKKNFSGKVVVDLLGQRDLSMREATQVIGRAADRPALKYVEFSFADTKSSMIQNGFTTNVADLFIEMSRAFNDGLIRVNRTTDNTTQTSFEEFAKVFPKLMQG